MSTTAYDDQFAPDSSVRNADATQGRQPIYPWSGMKVGDVIVYPVATDREARNIRRNVSQNGRRNNKAFRVKLNRKTTPATMTVARVR